MNYMLYGANGYTGKLMLEEAYKRGHRPIVAGRNDSEITQLAEKYALSSRIFPLDDPEVISDNLEDVEFIVNAAGPFEKTAMPLVLECLKRGIHYLDITGEIGVFEQIKQYDKQARAKKVMLLPGIGFDVVPTDCMASYLAEQLENADLLELAFTAEGSGMSHGTASTAVSQLGNKGFIRSEGQLKEVPIAHKSKEIDFGQHVRNIATIPWGDVSTAYTSTGIPNIEVYTAMPKSAVRMMKMGWLINPLLRTKFVKKLAQNWVDKKLDGPDEEERRTGYGLVYGKITRGDQHIESFLKCPEVYQFTVLSSLNIIGKVLKGEFTPGYQTPSLAYGWKLIEEIEGCQFYKR